MVERDDASEVPADLQIAFDWQRPEIEETAEADIPLGEDGEIDWWQVDDPFELDGHDKPTIHLKELGSPASIITLLGLGARTWVNRRVARGETGSAAKAATIAHGTDFLDGKVAKRIDRRNKRRAERGEEPIFMGSTELGRRLDPTVDQITGFDFTLAQMKAGNLPLGLGTARVMQKGLNAAIAVRALAEGVEVKVTKKGAAVEMVAFMAQLGLLHAENLRDPAQRRAARIGALSVLGASVAAGVGVFVDDYLTQYHDGVAAKERRSLEADIFHDSRALMARADDGKGSTTALTPQLRIVSHPWGHDDDEPRSDHRMSITYSSPVSDREAIDRHYRVLPDGRLVRYYSTLEVGSDDYSETYAAPVASELIQLHAAIWSGLNQQSAA